MVFIAPGHYPPYAGIFSQATASPKWAATPDSFNNLCPFLCQLLSQFKRGAETQNGNHHQLWKKTWWVISFWSLWPHPSSTCPTSCPCPTCHGYDNHHNSKKLLNIILDSIYTPPYIVAATAVVAGPALGSAQMIFIGFINNAVEGNISRKSNVYSVVEASGSFKSTIELIACFLFWGKKRW